MDYLGFVELENPKNNKRNIFYDECILSFTRSVREGLRGNGNIMCSLKFEYDLYVQCSWTFWISRRYRGGTCRQMRFHRSISRVFTERPCISAESGTECIVREIIAMWCGLKHRTVYRASIITKTSRTYGREWTDNINKNLSCKTKRVCVEKLNKFRLKAGI